MRVTQRIAGLVRRRRLHLTRPFLVPGAAALHRLRWSRFLRKRPVVALDEHVAGLEVDAIEQPIPCHLCGARRVQPLFVARASKRGRSYHVVRCPSCGLLYRNPGIRPERLGELYAGQYSRFLTGRYGAARKRRYALVMDAFAPLFEDGGGRRVFDFGCGTGLFLDLARERGFEPYGADLSRDSIELARTRPSGANAYFGEPRDIPEIAAGGFDVVTMWSVLAHLATPVEDLRLMRSLLADDGVLVILTVNANSLLLKAHREQWNGFTPNHLAFYSPTTLAELLRLSGFGSFVTRPAYGDLVETGTAKLPSLAVRRLRRTIERGGNQGNMLRAVAFADPGGPARWGMAEGAERLVGGQRVRETEIASAGR